MGSNNTSSIYYGYWVAASCFAIQCIGVGTFIAFGVFFKPLLAEFGWSRASLSGAFSMTFMLLGVFGIFVGILNDRFGPRIIMLVSGSLLGLAYIFMSQVNELWHVYLFFGLIGGIGMSTIDVIALSTTARWFVARRGIMTGIVKVGTGAGQFIIPFTAGAFITAYGWRPAYLVFGFFVPASLIALGMVLRRDPGQIGLLPDGAQNTHKNQMDQELGLTLAEALRTWQFWMVCVVNLMALFCMLTILTHIVAHTMDAGISEIKAAGVLSTIGGVSMIGRFITGIAIDRIGNKRSMIICFLVLIGSLIWLLAAQELWMLYLFAAIYGLAHGGFFTVISPIVAEFFGIRSHGILFGVVVFSGAIGAAIGPIVAGRIFDITASYRIDFFLLLGIGILGLIFTSFLKPAFKSA